MKELSKMSSSFQIDKEKSLQNELSVQEALENFMQEAVKLGNYEAVFLFDAEGLILAQSINGKTKSSLKPIEISVLMAKFKRVIQSIGNLQKIKEIIIEDEERKKLVIRFLEFLEQPTTLVIVVPQRKAFKNVTNRLEAILNKYSKPSEAKF